MRLGGRKSIKYYLKLIAVLTMAAVIFFIIFNYIQLLRIKDSQDEELLQLKQEYVQKLSSVYVAAKPILAGETIQRSHITFQKIYSKNPTTSFIDESDIGKIALVDIAVDLPIYKSMLTESDVTKDVREEEFLTISLSSNLQEHDYIDLRVLYPNGEDYIVLSKKQLKQVDLANAQCLMWLNEEELLSVSSVIVDSFLREGTRLYMVKYVNPALQPPSIANYQPREEVIQLMNKDPNILEEAKRAVQVKIRRELEERLNNFYVVNNNVRYEYPKAADLPSVRDEGVETNQGEENNIQNPLNNNQEPLENKGENVVD